MVQQSHSETDYPVVAREIAIPLSCLTVHLEVAVNVLALHHIIAGRVRPRGR
jgi:hypothetical protein